MLNGQEETSSKNLDISKIYFSMFACYSCLRPNKLLIKIPNYNMHNVHILYISSICFNW